MLPNVSSAAVSSPSRILVTFDQEMLDNSAFVDVDNYDISPSIIDFENSTLTRISGRVVAIDLTVGMLGGETYRIDVSQDVTSIAGEPVSFDQPPVLFVGVGSRARVTSVSAIDNNTVQVNFSNPMDLAGLSNSRNFRIGSRTTGNSVAVSASTPDLGVDGFYRSTILTISPLSKMTNGGIHSFEARDLDDVSGNRSSVSQQEFVGIGQEPTVLSCEMDELRRRLTVTFDSPMDDVWTLAPGSFLLSADAAELPDGYYSEATLSDDRTSVFLSVSEMRIGAPYTVVAGPFVRDEFGNTVDSGSNSSTFVGVGSAPTLVRCVATGVNRMDLIFSEPMRDNAELRNPLRYSADGGLSVLSVVEVVGDTVKLATSDQISGQNYTITIS